MTRSSLSPLGAEEAPQPSGACSERRLERRDVLAVDDEPAPLEVERLRLARIERIEDDDAEGRRRILTPCQVDAVRLTRPPILGIEPEFLTVAGPLGRHHVPPGQERLHRLRGPERNAVEVGSDRAAGRRDPERNDRQHLFRLVADPVEKESGKDRKQRSGQDSLAFRDVGATVKRAPCDSNTARVGPIEA